MSNRIQPENTGAFEPQAIASLTGLLMDRPAQWYHILGARNAGWSSTSLFGDACNYLDTTQADMNVIPSAATTLYLRSSSVNDAAAGTGARTVRIVYLDTNGLQQTTTATLNGTTQVSLGTGFTAIQWMETATAGTGNVAAGNITISSTNGAPTVATTFEQIDAGGNRSLSGRYKVPSDCDAYLTQWDVASIATTMDCRLRVDCFSDDRTLSAGVFHFNGRIFLPSNTSESEDHLPWLKCPAGSTIKVSAIPGLAPAVNKLDASFVLACIKR